MVNLGLYTPRMADCKCAPTMPRVARGAFCSEITDPTATSIANEKNGIAGSWTDNT